MAQPQRVQKLQKEGRLNLALSAIQKNRFSSKRQAASTYNVSRTTLSRRDSGIQPKLGSRASNRLLLDCEEEVLISWIHNIERRGYLSFIIDVRRIAQILLARRDASSLSPVIGKNWIYK
jgi:hypothetical protein